MPGPDNSSVIIQSVERTSAMATQAAMALIQFLDALLIICDRHLTEKNKGPESIYNDEDMRRMDDLDQRLQDLNDRLSGGEDRPLSQEERDEIIALTKDVEKMTDKGRLVAKEIPNRDAKDIEQACKTVNPPIACAIRKRDDGTTLLFIRKEDNERFNRLKDNQLSMQINGLTPVCAELFARDMRKAGYAVSTTIQPDGSASVLHSQRAGMEAERCLNRVLLTNCGISRAGNELIYGATGYNSREKHKIAAKLNSVSGLSQNTRFVVADADDKTKAIVFENSQASLINTASGETRDLRYSQHPELFWAEVSKLTRPVFVDDATANREAGGKWRFSPTVEKARNNADAEYATAYAAVREGHDASSEWKIKSFFASAADLEFDARTALKDDPGRTFAVQKDAARAYADGFSAGGALDYLELHKESLPNALADRLNQLETRTNELNVINDRTVIDEYIAATNISAQPIDASLTHVQEKDQRTNSALVPREDESRE